MKRPPTVTSRMAIGEVLQSTSVRDSVSGLSSYITSYFTSTAPQTQFTPNRSWNDTINSDADGMFRVYYQNVHGVARDDVSLAQDLQALAEFDVGCFCLSETNLDWNRLYVKYDFLSRQRKTWKHAATSFSSIEMESSSDYMTGGTLTSIVDKWSSRVSKKENDPSGMGRWSSQTLVGKQNSKITIITGYRCVRNNECDHSAWTQERIYMRDRQSKTSPHPRKQFIKDLIAFINDRRRPNHDIILNLDANEVMGEESQGISRLMRECALVDLLDIPNLEAADQLHDTYRHGNNRRIDFMLGTQHVQTCIRRRGALEYNDGIVSDHRGLYVDLDPVMLFGGNPDDPVALSSRGFTSKNAKKCKEYLDQLDRYFIDHKIVDRIDKLVEEASLLPRTKLKRRYESIDNDITRGMLAAEYKVRPSKHFKYEWSVELDEAGYCLRYWRVRYSDVKNNSTSHKALGHIFKRAGLTDGDDDPLWELEKILEKLKAARAVLKVAQKLHRDKRDECLKQALERHEATVRDSDDPKATKKAAAAVESIIRQNRTLESYARIKRVTKPGSGSGLQRVDVPKHEADGRIVQDEDGKEVREVLLEVADIHKAILARNKQHFHQANATPFGGGAENTVLYDLLGYTGMSQAARHVVEGTFMERYRDQLSDILPETEQVIKELSMPEEIKILG